VVLISGVVRSPAISCVLGVAHDNVLKCKTAEMAGTQATEYEQYWLHEVNSLHSEYKEIVAKYPDAAPVMEQVHKVLCDIVSLAG